ncbi:MAG TPA: DUF1559 domain-containing protein [Pirellulales bacterium]
MRRWLSVAAVAAVGLTGSPAFAQSDPAGKPAEVAREATKSGPVGVETTLAAPFIDDNTSAIVRIEPGRVNIDEALAFVKRVLPPDVPIEPAAVGGAAGVLAQWKAAGAKEAYLIVNVLRPTSPPLFVIPLPAGAEERDLKMLLKISPWNTIERRGDVLIAGDAKTVEAAKKVVASPRPELETALKFMGPAAVSAAMAFTRDQRRVLREMLPPVPEEFGGAETNRLLEDVQWIAASIDAPPTAAARVVVKASSPDAAKRMVELNRTVLAKGLQNKELLEELPNAPELAKVFQSQVDEDRVVWQLREGDEVFERLRATLQGPIAQARIAAKRMQSMNNLKQIGLAAHMYLDANRTFPAAASRGADGKPLLSWRVHILPFIEQQALYNQFKLDEPWDSEHNRKLASTIPVCYRHPATKLPGESGKTNYLAVVGSDTVFGRKEGRGISAITDGTSNTIMVVEVNDDAAVIWTKPDDWEVNAANPLHDLGDLFEHGFNALFADGSVRFVAKQIDAKSFSAYITASGGEVINQ